MEPQHAGRARLVRAVRDIINEKTSKITSTGLAPHRDVGLSAEDERLDVRERQNRHRSLDRLADQRWLYGQAKKAENWRLVSAIAVAGLLLSGLAIGAELYSQLATISIVGLWFFDQVVLVPSGVGKKEEAAAIREDFDCFVLDLPWPKHNRGDSGGPSRASAASLSHGPACSLQGSIPC